MYHTYTVGLGLMPFTVGCRSGLASHENYEGITTSKRSNASSPVMFAIAFGQLTQLASYQATLVCIGCDKEDLLSSTIMFHSKSISSC